MNNIERIKELIEQLNVYRDEYYNKSNPSVGDKEYDKLFDELAALEKETGIYMSNSPTQTVGYEVKSELEKVRHSHPMLSLSKTKSVKDLVKFAGTKAFLLSLKMDGLTVLLTYDNGELVQAETRGNGENGEIITHTAKVFENVPLHINYPGYLEVEGEAIITYEDFEAINKPLIEKAKKEAVQRRLTGDDFDKYVKDNSYKNPRNLVSGSVRQLDSNIAAQRHIKFIAWKVPVDIISGYINNNNNSFTERLKFVKELGFDIVPYMLTNDTEHMDWLIENLQGIAKKFSYPIDGLVITYDNISYGQSLGMTGHHPRHSIAFKFEDEEVETTIIDVEFTMGKTGVLTPTAIFEPVEIDGTEVERASVHNISILKELKLGIGDIVTVYKANAIIPQISENLTQSNTLEIPTVCPICGSTTEIKKDNETEVLICTNEDCNGKLLGKLAHFSSKNAIDIDGLSEATLQFLINKKWVSSFLDIYTNLNKKEIYKVWINTSGFGKKSVDKLLGAIEKSRNTSLERFLYAQSIPLIGRSASKDIARFCHGDIETFCEMMTSGSCSMFLGMDGFGKTMYESLLAWYNKHWIGFLELKQEFVFENINTSQNNKSEKVDLSGKVFVITGNLKHYANRDALVAEIESRGGKVSGSVSAKTSFLLNNDVESNSSKNAKAKSLNIPILSEEDFINMITS